jgi:DNA-binding transcriptional LysR family regulator
MLFFRQLEVRMTVGDEISDLRLFTRIVAAGSLSEAARRSFSSLPAVSRRLAALEERLGVRLIDRGPRRFSLTDEGSLLHERAVIILRDLDSAEAEASARAKQPRGHLRIGTHLEFGRHRIAPLIGEFTARYPHITAELLLTDSRLNILEEEIDVGLHLDPPGDSNVVARVVLSSPRIVCASPAYLAAHPGLNRPADLLKHDCIRLVRGRHVLDRWLFKEDGRVTEIQVLGSLLTDNGEVVHDWALAGRAVALKMEADIQEDLRSGRLVRLLESFECDESKLYVTYATRTHLPPRVRLFIDFVVNALQKLVGARNSIRPETW